MHKDLEKGLPTGVAAGYLAGEVAERLVRDPMVELGVKLVLGRLAVERVVKRAEKTRGVDAADLA
jgi:hypothetical protein